MSRCEKRLSHKPSKVVLVSSATPLHGQGVLNVPVLDIKTLQVAEAALARDASAAASGLRVPPKVVRYVSDAMSMVDSLLGALPISGTLIMDSNSLPGMSPSPQRSGFQVRGIALHVRCPWVRYTLLQWAG